MKKVVLIAFLFCVTSAFSIAIPKKYLGQYDTEVPAFEFEDNGHTVTAGAYTMSIVLQEEYMWYQCGKLRFYGEYLELKDEGEVMDINVEVSNTISIGFDIDISINKNSGAVAVKGLKGLPNLAMKKREIVVTKKNRGFSRL